MKKKLSSSRIDQILANSEASLKVEGLEVLNHETEVLRKYMQGIYNEKEVLRIIKDDKI